ncbi:MAG: hypothetical protein IJV06_05100 [Bacteroidaceae bacterium]|nr:hypothetical protein [Bacteroidaceae bacterium]
MFALALCVVSVGVQAEKVFADLSKYNEKWDGTDVSFSWTATYGNQLSPELTECGIPKGDLRNWEKLVVVVDELTNCDFFRVLVYSGDDTNHSNTFKATKTGTNEFTLSGNVDYLNNVTKIVLSGSNWEDSKSGTWSTTPASFKVKEVYLERPDIVYIEANSIYEAPAGTTDLKNLTGTNTNWANTVSYPKELAVQGQAFGDGNGDKESTHVNISGYDYICFEVTEATSKTAGLRVWIWDDVEEKVVTLYSKPIAEYATATWTEYSQITGVGTYVVKVSGYKYLKGVKAYNDYTGVSAAKVSMAYMCRGEVPVAYKPTGKYSLVGKLPGSATLADALADASATSYDATGIIATDVELTPANLNALFIANAGVLSNAQNVIVDGTCANLVLTDGYAFKAPAGFTATSASYTTTINETAKAGTLCLPFDATIPEGVTAYTLAYTSGDAAAATAVETTIPANTPVLLNGSGSATFEGTSVAIDADANNVSGAMTGVFETTKVPTGSYVLQNGNDGVGFYKVASSDIVAKPFRAYLTAQSSGAKIRIDYTGTDDATGINLVNAQNVEDGVIYNLSGMRVSQPTKGIYIKNGKKFIVK